MSNLKGEHVCWCAIAMSGLLH